MTIQHQVTWMIIHKECITVWEHEISPTWSWFNSVSVLRLHNVELLEIGKDEKKDAIVAKFRILYLDLRGREQKTHKNCKTKLEPRSSRIRPRSGPATRKWGNTLKPEDSQYPSQESNLAASRYKSRSLALHQRPRILQKSVTGKEVVPHGIHSGQCSIRASLTMKRRPATSLGWA